MFENDHREEGSDEGQGDPYTKKVGQEPWSGSPQDHAEGSVEQSGND